MKFFNKKKLTIALVLATAAMHANATTITNTNGTFDFGGFDWASNGSAWIQGYDIVSGGSGRVGETDTFTLKYMANAVALQDSNGTNYGSGAMPGLNTAFEYTIYATITEQITCLTSNCNTVQIDVVSGTWNVYYDTTPATFFSNTAGTGVTNGTIILTGDFAPSPISQSLVAPQGPTNPGNVSLLAALKGDVTTTNTTYINPELAGTTAVSTLQFGNTTTAWTRPASFNGAAIGPNTNNSFVGQADANQNFVPEPGSLALLSLGLGLLGFARSRKAV